VDEGADGEPTGFLAVAGAVLLAEAAMAAAWGGMDRKREHRRGAMEKRGSHGRKALIVVVVVVVVDRADESTAAAPASGEAWQAQRLPEPERLTTAGRCGMWAARLGAQTRERQSRDMHAGLCGWHSRVGVAVGVAVLAWRRSAMGTLQPRFGPHGSQQQGEGRAKSEVSRADAVSQRDDAAPLVCAPARGSRRRRCSSAAASFARFVPV